MLDATPPPSPQRGSSPPAQPKKRRLTVGGLPHPLNTDVRITSDQSCSTPISPVVMGFTIQRDNPSAMEQVKSMITVKQKQKALIEQRRGSIVTSPIATAPSSQLPLQSPVQDRTILPSKPPPQVRSSRRSPNNGLPPRRSAGNATHSSVCPPRPSPPPNVIGQQQASLPSPLASAQSLPPPPISFARRRADLLGKGKKKPADIVISPREAQAPDQFQPTIQSAPPVQTSFSINTFPMTLPRLPSAMGGTENVRRVAGNVPPTPTRLSMQSNPPSLTPQSLTSISGRSPPAPLVAIASTLVPPTPGFHHAGSPDDKSAFLAPFGVFYDALHDSKQLKTWLGDQLQRSNALIQTLTEQQDKVNELVEVLVEKKVAGMRSEMLGLHRRVEELEESLRVARSQNPDAFRQQQDRAPLRNGLSRGTYVSEPYVFPSVASSSGSTSLSRSESERKSTPRQGPERGPSGEIRDTAEVQNGSPRPSDPPLSASRLEHPRIQAVESRLAQGFRDPSLPSLAGHGKPERPSLSRRSSGIGLAVTEQRMGSSPLLRRSDSRMNSATMSPPDIGGDNS